MIRLRIAPRFPIVSGLVLGCLAALVVPPGEAHAEPRAVIELFTSQGCSSCPAADQLLGEIAKDPSVVALTLPVDYWDYLGWKDTLALKGHATRQRAYAKARGDREVYTPQAVINGVVHVLGSDKAAIERAIVDSRKPAAPPALGVNASVSGGTLNVTLPAAEGRAAGDVWLCPVTRSVPVKIGRGENRGQTITYSNVVRRWVKLGEWNGKAATFTVPLNELQTGDIDTVAVMVQSGGANEPKLVIGAAQVPIR